ncbi:uncharacterized protein LOC117806483 [Xyrichtys novacula]|uniref:Uncharacterized protein LOC117806483 n=1 Tax=Xyrichtys novacula TaxID=13765 RepID=A0AAV1GJF7_XYRNO|nr:uncharacterized protein LOC117806483 [Xyrichtys novacula]
MEDEDNSGDTFDDRFNQRVNEEDFNTDENTIYSNQGMQKVSMTVPESNLKHYKLLAFGLAVLAVILLAVDIGLGVYYYTLSNGLYLVTDINSELTKLHASYNKAEQKRDDARRELARVIDEQQLTKWELEHQKKRCDSYKKEVEKIQVEIATLKSHLPMLGEGCKHCLAGWTFMNSACYYFAFSSNQVRRSWSDARAFCKLRGGDLTVIDSREEHMAIYMLIRNYRDPRAMISISGFWIGLTDMDNEGDWRWLNGARLTDSYWNTGEPNDMGQEDCAATYPRDNPFFAWNDAPCGHDLKWICEMEPRFSS